MEKENINLEEVLQELDNDILNNDIIQDNKIVFSINEKIYRVRMPNQRDLLFANENKNRKYVELLKQPDTITIKQLTKILKEKGIDIKKMSEECDELETLMTDTYLALAKKKDSEKKEILKLKKKLEEIRQKRMAIVLEKAGLLAPAIENQVNDFYYQCLTAVCTEKYEEKINKKKEKIGKWDNVWNSFEEYQKDDSKLAYIAIGKLTELIYTV